MQLLTVGTVGLMVGLSENEAAIADYYCQDSCQTRIILAVGLT